MRRTASRKKPHPHPCRKRLHPNQLPRPKRLLQPLPANLHKMQPLPTVQLPARLQWSPCPYLSPRLRLQRAARWQRRSKNLSRKRRWCGSQRPAPNITAGQTAAIQKVLLRCQSAGLLQWAWNHVSAATKQKEPRPPVGAGERGNRPAPLKKRIIAQPDRAL